MKTTGMFLIVALATGCAAADAGVDAVAVGQPAPDFALTDLDGTTHRLSDYAGKVRVLEWFNPGCPYVKYAHGEGPLADRARRATSEGVVWLAINSGAPGKQGHGVQANKDAAAQWGMTHPVLIDEDGTVGRTYGAKTTPQMYVINEQGVLVYQGALDNAPFGRVEGAPRAFFDVALASTRAGNAVKTPQTKPYGCSVKY